MAVSNAEQAVWTMAIQLLQQKKLDMQAKIDYNTAQIASINNTITTLQTQRSDLNKEANKLTNQIAVIDAEIAEYTTQLAG